MRRIRLVRGFIWGGLVMTALVASLARGADDPSPASVPPPAIYQEKLAKLLTPLDDILKKKDSYSHLQGDSIVLLDETVTYVGEDGKRVTAFHSIYQALNDAGVKALAQDTLTYKKHIQHVYMALGQTIQPDGTKDPVKGDAVFVKSPQDQADDSIYDDEMQLVLVYSNVKPGSITESITVLEDDEARIPGEYSQTHEWRSGWPEYLQRLVVDLPKAVADRLKVTNLGQSVPTPTVTTAGDREQMTWEKLNTPADDEDDSEAPADQIGPIVWLSTMKSWDAFASWYFDQAKGTVKIDDALKAKIDAWTKDAKTPEEVLGILYGHVSRDVRYTGFELGKSDLQPHDSMSVWQRQYGDCKDKANLLRAMLATKGIDSWLVLLDTEHAGAVNKANPDYRQFDHCIVNVKLGDKTLFVDPTIDFASPGLLDGGETDRDVLVIKDGHADWERTPPFHDAALTYTFDLKLRPNGELAGWVELKATGYYSASYEKKYRDLTKDQVRETIEQDVQGFFPNSSVADVEPLKAAAPPGQFAADAPAPFTVRAYMTLTGVLNQGDGPSELKFPAPDGLLPSTTNYKSRQHTTYTWPDFNQVTAKIELPPGWHPAALPAPFTYDSPSANFAAAWTADQTTLTANCTATIKHSLFPSDEWQAFGDAITNLLSWTSKSLDLTKSTDAQAATPATKTDAELAADLPVMPTGDGELNLIDSEFPSDGNVAARRAALERIPTLFASDQKSIVEAAVKLAALDLDDEKWDAVISRIKPIEEANRAVLDPDTLAWADYVVASALDGQGKKDDAHALFQKIAENTDVDSGRRGWATYRVAELLVDKSPGAALDFADKGLGLDSSVIPELYAFYATTAVSNKMGDRLKDRLTKLIATKPENLEDILLKVTDAARDLIDNGHKAEGLDLVTILEALSDPATTGEAVAKAIKDVRDGAESMALYSTLQKELQDALKNYPDIAALERKQPKFASAADVEKSISQHEDASEANDALGCALRVTIGYPVDEQFPHYFWECVREADWTRRNSTAPAFENFFFGLAQQADRLPHSSDGYADIKLLQAKTLGEKGKHDEAAAIFDALAKQTDLADGYGGALALWNGQNWEDAGDYVKALACYAPAEKVVDTESKAREAILRSAFIQFDNGNTAEAFRLVQVLAQSAQKGKIQTGEQVANVIVLAKDSAPPKFWDNYHNWWPQWQQIETVGGLEPLKDRKVIPIIPSLADLGRELGTAKNNKDTKHFFEIMREMAYASRFYPNALDEFVGVFSYAEEVVPDHANDFRKLAIAMLEPLSPTDPAEQRTRVLHLLINYVDTAQNQKALDLMSQSWKPELEDSSNVTAAIHRVWSIAAVAQHQDLEQVATAMENDLKAPPTEDRALTVGVLADVYVALGRKPDAEKLLETELANPALSTASQPDLKARLDNIQNASETSKQLADGVTAWLKDHQPSWWNYAEPKSVDDPRLARLEEILKNPQGELQPAEIVKAGLLAPSVAALSPAVQEDAVLKAFTTLLGAIPAQDDANLFAHSVLDSAQFPASLKTAFLYAFLLDAYEKHQLAAFDTFYQLPLYQTLPDQEKVVMDRIAAFNKVDRTSSAQLNAYVQKLTGHPMDSLDLGVVEDTLAALLLMGDIDSAEALYHAVPDYSFAPNAGHTKPEFQLTLLKQINFAKKLKPVTDALGQTALAAQKLDAQKLDAIPKSASFDQRRNFNTLADLTEDDATTMRLDLIKTHQAPFNLFFWFEFMRDQPHDAAGYDLNLSLIKAGLDATTEDELKAGLAMFAPGVVDVDQPELRKKLLDLMQPYRDPGKFPRTAEQVRMFETMVALRTGAPFNIDTDLTGFNGAYNANEANHLKLRALLQGGDAAKLESALNQLSPEQMMAPQVVRDAVPALELAGMKDEAQLARDTLTRQLYQEVLAVWLTADGNRLRGIGQMMNALGSTQAVPAEFTAFVQGQIARKDAALNYELYKAYIDKDWPGAATLGAQFVQTCPDDYTALWLYGRALAELGKKDEATKVLTEYCQYSKDEVWYPQAKALLAKLAAPAP